MKRFTTETPCPDTTACWGGRSLETGCMAGRRRSSTGTREVHEFLFTPQRHVRSPAVSSSINCCYVSVPFAPRVTTDVHLVFVFRLFSFTKCEDDHFDLSVFAGTSRDSSYIGKILEGFTLAQKPAEEKTVSISANVRPPPEDITRLSVCPSLCLQIFPPPTLPSNYRPIHRFRPAVDVSHLSGVSPALAEALRTSRGHMVKEEPQQGGRHQLDSDGRRILLGEDVLRGESAVVREEFY